MSERVSDERMKEIITDSEKHTWPTCCPWASAKWTEIIAMARDFLALRASHKALYEALAWYAAEQAPNEFYIVDAKSRAFISDMADWGGKARAALATAKQLQGAAEQKEQG